VIREKYEDLSKASLELLQSPHDLVIQKLSVEYGHQRIWKTRESVCEAAAFPLMWQSLPLLRTGPLLGIGRHPRYSSGNSREMKPHL
jgi:hypothetical protein